MRMLHFYLLQSSSLGMRLVHNTVPQDKLLADEAREYMAFGTKISKRLQLE
jgi:hypothetical protein